MDLGELLVVGYWSYLIPACLAFNFPLYLYAPHRRYHHRVLFFFVFLTLLSFHSMGAFFVYLDGKRLGGGELLMT